MSDELGLTQANVSDGLYSLIIPREKMDTKTEQNDQL